MSKLKLSNFFTGAGAKRLSVVEIDKARSNQHEFNGVAQFRELLGDGRRKLQARFIYLTDEDYDNVVDEGSFTWYDARENDQTRSSEYRLYYSDNMAISAAGAGDLLILAKFREEDQVLVIIARAQSTIENQLMWLFGFGQESFERFFVKRFDPQRLAFLDYISGLILENIGIIINEGDNCYYELLLQRFPEGFPSTRDFSEFTRELVRDRLDFVNDPDDAVLVLMEKEEELYRICENREVEKRLEQGFCDVNDFLAFSLSVQNKRKSRAGFAFENHLETIFAVNNLRFDRNQITENRSRPDFIFPGIEQYRREEYSAENLTMLGVKTTCKERWRQVLAEADRIPQKHLATLEGAISVNQLHQMREFQVTLVAPRALHDTYDPLMQDNIISLADFIALAQERDQSEQTLFSVASANL